MEAYLDAYIEAAGLANDRKGPLFRSARGKSGQLTDEAMSRVDVWKQVNDIRLIESWHPTKVGITHGGARS